MEMVERVGRAVVDHLGVSLAFTETHDTDTPTIRACRDADTKQALAIACAAIEAMREPTEAMLEAANEHDRGMMPWREQYQAMIRAALPSPAIDDMDRK